MIDIIKNFFLETVGKELCVFFCSLLPIIECRGAIPLGCGLGLSWWKNFLLAFAGNILPVPFILLFIQSLLKWMESSKVRLFNRFAGWLHQKVEKHKGTIEKYSYLGILLFVAIPIPGTGAWTGSLIASMLGMDWKKSTLAATAGVFVACVIVTILSYGIKAIV